MKQLTPVGELNRAVSSTYRHAAGGVLEWKQEKAFFEAQIKKNWQIARAVNNGVTATIESLKLAVRECASMGLSMSPAAQLVYFIPRHARKRKPNESKSEYESTVPFIVSAPPSYRGLAFIGTHYCGCEVFAAEVVFEADKFRYFGPLKMPDHEPTLDNKLRNESQAIGVYCIVKMQDGTFRCEYVDAPTVLKIRQLSDFPNGIMYTKLWTEGWKKIAVRRLCKLANITASQMQSALIALNRHDGISFDEIPTTEAEARERLSTGVAGLGQAMQQKVIEHDEPIDAEPTEAITLQSPAESKQPPGTIEWWCDQIRAAESLQRLDDIRAAALLDGVDQSEDADAFREQYSSRFNAIKERDSQ